MLDSEQRKQIGARIKQRRLELDLPMQYVADQMGVNKSTVQRYESGTIDNTKKMVLEGLSRVLDVTPEWLLSGIEAQGDRSNPQKWHVVDSKTEAGMLLTAYNSMDAARQARLLGYAEALSRLKEQKGNE